MKLLPMVLLKVLICYNTLFYFLQFVSLLIQFNREYAILKILIQENFELIQILDKIFIDYIFKLNLLL